MFDSAPPRAALVVLLLLPALLFAAPNAGAQSGGTIYQGLADGTIQYTDLDGANPTVLTTSGGDSPDEIFVDQIGGHL